jgi:DNA-binding MarR family transcriptional regulator
MHDTCICVKHRYAERDVTRYAAGMADSPATPDLRGSRGTNVEVLAEIERALIRLRRRQTRRRLAQQSMRQLGVEVDLALLDVVDAVEAGPEESGPEPAERNAVTVGVVAERLGLDPSRASRMVAAAVEAGYVRRVASQGDGRRSCLELTDTGRDIVAAAHRARQALYERLLADWPESERAEFARLLTRFTSSMR